MNNLGRVKYLDGLRGLAIFFVVLFHAYARWKKLVPFGVKFSEIWIFKYGYIGVSLFFILSGYVISLSLENSSSYLVFLKKRWLRLFPAMFIVTVLIFLTYNFFLERPAGEPTLLNAIPGLIFIEDKILQFLLNVSFKSIEGAFWSIYVETKFYVLVGLLFFFVKKKFLPISIMSFFLIHIIMGHFVEDLVYHKLITLSNMMSFQFFGWFAVGASLYEYKKSDNYLWLFFSVISTLFCAYFSWDFLPHLIFGLFFIACVCFSFLQRILNNKFLLFLGYISYPLYLIHENMMVSLILKLGKLQIIPDILLPVIPIAVVVVLAFIIKKYFEDPLYKILSSILTKKIS